ncbi:hypothetical protein [Methanosarcina sp. KYL-1]|uniref:hypothetical protein n=1 Tax=Methanosarcina sp. KYL-1 TaxID=2602068 RepID=UPI0021010C4B|nr:hypothetical protein [Methanosarcina sp. KYL-1]
MTLLLLLFILCFADVSAAETGEEPSGNLAYPDFTESGHYDTDFNASFMSEWWYQNGDMRLVSEDGEKRNLAFFIVVTHQESPELFRDPDSGLQLSNMATFYGLYPYGEATAHNFTQVFIPRSDIENYIGFHVPYLDYTFPEGLRRLYGSSFEGYGLDYTYDNLQLDLVFKPRVEKTIDSAIEPVNFTTYESAYGKLEGTVVLDGKEYVVTQADGYFDHMIPYTTTLPVWEMEMHGWSWAELTTDSYQTVLYVVRGLEDGYDTCTYKHLTLIDKHTGEVVAEYSGDDVEIVETDWVNLTVKGVSVKRPATLEVSAPGLHIDMEAQSVVQFDAASYPEDRVGFIDFMAFQPLTASIEYDGNIEHGSAFYEYMITDWGAFVSSA